MTLSVLRVLRVLLVLLVPLPATTLPDAAARAVRRGVRWLSAITTTLVVGCGGGGSAGGPSAGGPSEGETIAGHVTPGPVRGAQVALVEVAPDGDERVLQTRTSDAGGRYAFTATPKSGAVVRIEATGGDYVDPQDGRTHVLDAPLRAAAVFDGTPIRVTVTPYSEVVVRSLPGTGAGAADAARVRRENAAMASLLGVEDVVGHGPLDLSRPVDAGSATADDLTMALYAGAFLGLRTEPGRQAARTTTDAMIVALRRVLIDDPEDDDAGPAFLRGLLTTLDRSSLPAEAKRAGRDAALFPPPIRVTVTPEQAFPAGIASGAASAPMSPEGDWLLLTGGLLSERRAISPRFNGRGALVEFRERTSQQRTLKLHTGSVADLHGDGEVGLGLWNGGIHLERSSDTQESWDTRAISPGGGMTYVLTRRASALPSAACGILRYALVAQTRSVLLLDGARSTVPVALDGSSRGAMLVAGDASQLELALVLRMPDGQLVRFGTTAGAIPWQRAVPVDPAPWHTFATTLQAVDDTPPPHAGTRLVVSGALAGTGARRVAMRIRLEGTSPLQEWAATFAMPADGALAGCDPAIPDSAPPISPPPADGLRRVFATGASGDAPLSSLSFVLLQSRFDAGGGLIDATSPSSVSLPILALPQGAPLRDRAGVADATIGRYDGPYALQGQPGAGPLHYATASLGAVPSTAGLHRYRLVAATRPTLWLGPSGPSLDGLVTSGTLELDFSDRPDMPSFGSMRVAIQGAIAGETFRVGNPSIDGGLLPGDLSLSAGNFGLEFMQPSTGRIAVRGTLAGTGAAHATLVYSARGPDGATLSGAALFVRETP